MSARTALLIAWGTFAVAVAAFVLLAGLAGAQSPASADVPLLCSDGVCVVLESQLRDFLQHLMNLQQLLDERKCI